MQDQSSGGAPSSSRHQDTLGGNIAGAAREAYQKAADLSGEAAERGRAAAAEGARMAKSQMKGVLDRQVGVAASVVGDVARSFHVAADDLERNAPFAGDLMHGLADRMSGYAEDLQAQNTDDLLRTASDFTRRQPAMVFGLAALAGFLMFRAIKHTPSSVQAPSIQPSQNDFSEDDEEEDNDSGAAVSAPPRRRRRKRVDDV
ncbi:hypothetical protein RA307_25750 [Xanthobacteraceae bacterium Astr-EGSB]|uniref:hypothetical protein n=1 Tax=Astrobacterium formosum TaxID=3069710 RepID=UPI0027AE4396|nr:hypothetical protein [Xanthobacteraceae bacterium Astr-EGSB]